MVKRVLDVRTGEIKAVAYTQEEIAAWERSMSDTPAPEPTAEERIAALEEQLAAAKILLGLEE